MLVQLVGWVPRVDIRSRDWSGGNHVSISGCAIGQEGAGGLIGGVGVQALFRALEAGTPVLVEGVHEDIDPLIDTLLSQKTFMQRGAQYIQVRPAPLHATQPEDPHAAHPGETCSYICFSARRPSCSTSR